MTTLDACIMRLQVIGEVIRAVDNKTEGLLFAQYPSLPWKRIVGMRNIISHEYANIDYYLIWDVFTTHLPLLGKEVEKIKKDLG